jgi:hypothetical protein
MTDALAAQADLHPGPASLPTRRWIAHVLGASHAAPSATRNPVQLGARGAADQASQQAQGQSQQSVVAHQAQAAAQSAAGQTQAEAAKARVAPHPHAAR